MLPEVAISEDEGDEDVNLAALDIEENSDQDISRGRPSNVSLNDFEWSRTRTDIDIPSFSQAVGPANVMPSESLAVDFFQLFVDNRMLGNILRETNRYACKSLRSANTMGLVPAISPCNKSQGLVVSCELATSPCD